MIDDQYASARRGVKAETPFGNDAAMVAKHLHIATYVLLVAAFAMAPSAHAQRGGGGDDDGPRGGRGGFGRGGFGGGPGGGFRGGPGGGFDPSAMAGRFDQDEDGEISPDELGEMPEFLRDRLTDQIREAGRDPDEAIAVDDLGKIMAEGFQRMREQGGGPGGGRGGFRGGPPRDGDDEERGPRGGRRGRGRDRGEESREEQPAAPQAVNDFGGAPAEASGEGRGRRDANRGDDDRPGDAAPDDQARRIAGRLLERVDSNGDGVLQEDEWSEYRLQDLSAADGDSNKAITIEELTQWTARTRRQVAAADGNDGESRPSRRSRAPQSSTVVQGSASGRNSYRLTAVKLPSGIPAWFSQHDADGDGQVMMHEWTSNWTNAALADFNGKDSNGDGVITPTEALAAGR